MGNALFDATLLRDAPRRVSNAFRGQYFPRGFAICPRDKTPPYTWQRIPFFCIEHLTLAPLRLHKAPKPYSLIESFIAPFRESAHIYAPQTGVVGRAHQAAQLSIPSLRMPCRTEAAPIVYVGVTINLEEYLVNQGYRRTKGDVI